jgi:hypothetical protein
MGGNAPPVATEGFVESRNRFQWRYTVVQFSEYLASMTGSAEFSITSF